MVFTQVDEDDKCTVYVEQTTAQVAGNGVTGELEQLSFPGLSPSQQDRVKELLNRHLTVFTSGDSDLGYTDIIEHEIPVLDDAPVHRRYRRLLPNQYGEVKPLIRQLLDQKVIEESCSHYSSPNVIVRKKDGSLQMCMDYRQLNSKTRKDAYPLPRISGCSEWGRLVFYTELGQWL